MFFANGNIGGIGLKNGTVLFTSDGGRTWARSLAPSGKAVTAIWMDASGRGFLATDNNNVAAPGVALSYADFDQGQYEPVQTAALEIRDISGQSRRLWAVGKVVGPAPNDVVLLIQPE
jgi:hypothetical protein